MDRHTPPSSQPVRVLGEYFATTLDRADREVAPPTFEDLAAYVNGTLDDVDREIVESYLEEDAALRTEVADLRALALAMREAPALAARRPLVPAAAPATVPVAVPVSGPASGRGAAAIWRRRPVMAWAAAATIASAVTWLAVRTTRVEPPTTVPSASVPSASTRAAASASPAVIHLRDAGRVVTVDASGAIAGLADDRPATAKMVIEALTTGTFPRASGLTGLDRRALTLLSGDDRPERFTPIAPVGTVVRDTRPELRWSPHPGARAYVVTIYTERFDKVLSSPPVSETRWSVGADLKPGAIYQWQVVADTADGPVRAPVPPASDARFRIMDAEARRTLERELARTGDSHLLTGLLFARAGALDEAEHAFTLLLADNPDSVHIKTLLRRVREQR
jgi:hypothetical protein